MYQRLNMSNRSKFIVYRNINPSYSVHSVYCSRNSLLIPEVYRISFSRLRLSSHRLRIETGRWSRIPRDRRLCPCGQIQDEEHVLAHCQITQDYTEIACISLKSYMLMVWKISGWSTRYCNHISCTRHFRYIAVGYDGLLITKDERKETKILFRIVTSNMRPHTMGRLTLFPWYRDVSRVLCICEDFGAGGGCLRRG